MDLTILKDLTPFDFDSSLRVRVLRESPAAFDLPSLVISANIHCNEEYAGLRMDLTTMKDLAPFNFVLALNPQDSRAVFSLTIGPRSLTSSYYHTDL